MALSLGLDPDYEVVAMMNTLDTVRSSRWGPRLTRWVAVGHVGVAGARAPVGAALITQATAVLFALLTWGAFHRCFSGARFEARPPSAVTVVQKTGRFHSSLRASWTNSEAEMKSAGFLYLPLGH